MMLADLNTATPRGWSLNTPLPGFTALFNGKHLTNWKNEGKAKGHWPCARRAPLATAGGR